MEYDPITGLFIRRRTGTVAGWLESNGYVKILLHGHRLSAHRLAWFYIHDIWTMVDHINGIRNDNAIINLRPATYKQNAMNRSYTENNSGTKGVYFRDGKYEVGIKVNKRRIYLGVFNTIEEAGRAYNEAAKKHFGEYASKAE